MSLMVKMFIDKASKASTIRVRISNHDLQGIVIVSPELDNASFGAILQLSSVCAVCCSQACIESAF